MAIDEFMTSVYSLETALTNYSKYTQTASGMVTSVLPSLSPLLVLLLGLKFTL